MGAGVTTEEPYAVRKNELKLKEHAAEYHHFIESILKDGIQLSRPDDTDELFSIIPILCADLGFLKQMLVDCKVWLLLV